MRRRAVVRVVLAMFALGVASGALAEVAHALTGHGGDRHADGAPCPDAEQGDHACSPSCACPCCPGHAPVVVSVLSGLASWRPPVVGRASALPREILASTAPSGVFRPPRA